MSRIWVILLLGVLVNGLRLRRCARALGVLEPSEEPVSADHAFLVARGVELDAATRRAASAHARARGLPLVDLVPGDLPVERALLALRLHVTPTYRSGGTGAGAGQALLVRRDVLERSGLGATGESLEAASPELMVRATRELPPCADALPDLVVAPGLRTPAAEPDGGLEYWARLFKGGVSFVAMVHLGEQLLLWAGLWLAPWIGWLALLAFHTQPWLIFGGGPLRPRDARPHVLARSPRVALTMLRLLGADRAARDAGHREERREHYREALEGGLGRFFQPRRTDCPLCSGSDLRPLLRSPDHAQQKPGEFALERCAGCGHIFQNPMLSREGLAFYYEDFYDGEGEDSIAFVFAVHDYTDRAECVRGLHEPRHWLDAGTGHGHFCARAREIWPAAVFDGLDMGSSVETAERRGWIRKGYRGLLPEIAPKLEGAYDVVSMFHSLEHTPDPLADLEAARRVLAPGGVLVVEVPDPECAYGRWFGSYWLPWFQPQHLHLLSLSNLRRLLEQRGFAVRREQRGECHIPLELSYGLFAAIGRVAPQLDLPWRPPSGLGQRLRRGGALLLCAPLLALAWALDQVQGYGARHWGWPSNTYRVVAQKIGVGGPEMEGSST